MKLPLVVVLLFALVPLAGQNPPARKRLLVIGRSQGFQHDSVSQAMGTLWKMGQDTGLWDTFLRTDTELITKKKMQGNRKNLDYFDAIFFYTSGELELTDDQKADFLSFIRDDGKGFLAAHSATDTFYQWPEYGELIGGYFDSHPWHQLVRVKVEDRSFPATRHFGETFEITDEIYQFRNFSRDKLKVLMSLDTDSVDLKKPNVHRTDGDFALTWTKQYGKGRVFYSALGHRDEVWNRPDIQKMWQEAIVWAMGK